MSDISQQMAEWGKRGGQSKSERKRRSSAANMAKARAARRSVLKPEPVLIPINRQPEPVKCGTCPPAPAPT